jgi:hypothetical protein
MALGGWASKDSSVANTVYGEGFPVGILSEKMALIGYEGLDLSHLKGPR